MIEAKEIKKCYGGRTVLNAISLEIARGETLGIVGESGCGKSTLGRMLLCLERPTSGEVFFKRKPLESLSRKALKQFRQEAQIVFQDPFASLNPRMSAGEIITEPLRIHSLLPTRKERRARVEQLLDQVGLSPHLQNRFPHEFSGGQRQRIGIARALAANPQFLVCDEPVSALDVSVQAQILNLFKQLQQELGLTYLFISHDLAVVKYLSDRIAVMYKGEIVELAPAEALYQNPLHPYTQALIAAIPIPDPAIERTRTRIPLKQAPSLIDPQAKGCAFADRCPFATPHCKRVRPKWHESGQGHGAACHLLDR